MNKGKGSLKTIIVMVILLLVGVLAVVLLNSAKTFLAGATADYSPETDASGKPLVSVRNMEDGKGVTVSWSSKKACMAYVEYGSSPATILVKTEEEKSPTTNHSVKISSLTGNKKNYYYRIRCGDDPGKKAEWEVFDNSGIPFSFNYEGKPASAGETPAPLVTQVQTMNPTTAPQPATSPAAGGSCTGGIDYNKDGKTNTLDLIFCRNQGGKLNQGSAAPTVKPTGAVTTPAATGSGTAKTCNSGVDYDGNGVVNALDAIKCRQSP